MSKCTEQTCDDESEYFHSKLFSRKTNLPERIRERGHADLYKSRLSSRLKEKPFIHLVQALFVYLGSIALSHHIQEDS